MSSSFYFVEGDYLIDCNIIVYKIGKSFDLGAKFRIKPLFVDDLFWEVFGMESNKNAPFSLRVNGAFSFRPTLAEFHRERLNSLELEKQVTVIIRRLLEFSKEIVNSFKSFDDFYNYATKKSNIGLFDPKLYLMINNIKDGNFYKALKLAQEELNQGRSGDFENEGKNIYEWVVEYCKERL